MTVLNVDDSMTMRKIVTLALKGQGHTVLEAENGRLALDLLPSQKVDAIILDINMPVMSGIDFLKEVRKTPNLAAIPVVVLTTQGEDDLKNQALALGAKAFMVKPFQKDELVAILNKITG
jgi:two-component system chemotaxis response regulator CheY